jgi:HD-GYP domain-containing protein (c-di-GMP phosphodiesterase class II)
LDLRSPEKKPSTLLAQSHSTDFATMIKKIPVDNLRPGMYVHDLGCRWMEHPFLRSRFRIGNKDQIRQIAEAGIGEVCIDTERGLDVPDCSPREEPGAQLQRELVSADSAPVSPLRAGVDEEFHHARRIYDEAKRVIHDLMRDVRLGRQTSIDRSEPMLEKIAGSILRNPGPMLALCRLKSNDEYTFVHSLSVGALMMMFWRIPGEEQTMREVGLGGLLHDVGKMTIPDAILNKRGRLTDEEFATMQDHVNAGLGILRATPGVTGTALDIVAQHHERPDGRGYPAGLKVEQISRFGQMAAIVDVYDAITSDRVYRAAMSPPEAMKQILEWTPDHFNPELVRTFIAAVGIYPTGTLVMLESGRVAVVIQHNADKPLQPCVRVLYDSLRGSHVEPHDLDLARSMGHGGADRVLRHEPPGKWSFNALSYLIPA